jgi:FeS assembly SUF system protein
MQPSQATTLGDPNTAELRQAIVDVLKTVYDPEIPVDIYELGLIYELEIDEERHVKVVMTLTSPMCPVAESLPPEVEQKIRGVPGVAHVDLELTWEPAWDPSRMSEAAKLELGY